MVSGGRGTAHSLLREGWRRRRWIRSIPEHGSPHLAVPIPNTQPPNLARMARFALLSRSSRLRGLLVLHCLQTLPGKVGLVARDSTFFPKNSAQDKSNSCAQKYPSEALHCPTSSTPCPTTGHHSPPSPPSFQTTEDLEKQEHVL